MIKLVFDEMKNVSLHLNSNYSMNIYLQGKAAHVASNLYFFQKSKASLFLGFNTINHITVKKCKEYAIAGEPKQLATIGREGFSRASSL